MFGLPIRYQPAIIFGLGVPELVIILVIVLLLFGGRAIPGLGKALGDTIRGIRGGTKQISEEESAKKEKESTKEEDAS